MGGGWSGIAAAWYLHQAGHDVTLYDQGESLGGRSKSALLGNRRVTLGGKNIGLRYALFREFVGALGNDDFEYFGINSSRIENGRIHTVDSSAKFNSVLRLLRRTSLADIRRMMRMVRLVRGCEDNRFLQGPGFTKLARQSGDVTLDRYFGAYLRAQLVRPMTVRMNGAEPDEVFLATFGTNLGMLLDRFEQLTAGFEPSFRAFSERVETKLRSRVEHILVRDGAATGVAVRTAAGGIAEQEAEAVVVALPSWDAAALAEPLHASLAATLREIRYFPVGVAIAEYDEPVFTPEVRALVLPPDSPLSNAGAYGVDDRHIVRYTFSGHAAREFLAEAPDAATLATRGEHELARYLPVPKPRSNVVAACWERGLCAYGPDHDARLSRIRAEAAQVPGLTLTGDYVRGASIEACFRAARDATATLTPSGTRTRSHGQTSATQGW